jgi:hypothetical protein
MFVATVTDISNMAENMFTKLNTAYRKLDMLLMVFSKGKEFRFSMNYLKFCIEGPHHHRH